MFGTSIVTDMWGGTAVHAETADEVSLAEVDRLIDRLDAAKYTMVTIRAEDDVHMAIGGGNGQYVVYATFDNLKFWNLLRSREKAEGVVMLNVGGQEGDYPMLQVVTKEQAKSAARTFAESGRLDETHTWQED